MANLKNTSINDAQFRLPVGDTAARPGSPNARQIRFNTETGKLEQFRPGVGAWIAPVNTGVIATGGDSVYDVDVEGTTYRVHVFTSTGASTFEVLQEGEVDVLVVGGGGGGGSTIGGGGGAGGFVYKESLSPSRGTYSIVVGDGGLGGYEYRVSTNGNQETGLNGDNTTAFGLTALGGGGGSGWEDNPDGGNGGSGGGGSADNTQDPGQSTQSGTNPTANIDAGNAGGNGDESAARRAGGGGGGAGAPGEDGVADNKVGNGGIGLAIDITGISQFYAGGGGGGDDYNGPNPNPGGFGGLGGGGRGGIDGGSATDPDVLGEDGVANTGGGGGSGSYTGRSDNDFRIGGKGGSGIVVIRYPLRQENPVTAPGRDVRDGLVLDLDFAKPTVYSGFGSTVSDSRLNGSNGTITGSTTFINSRTHRSAFNFAGNGGIQIDHNNLWVIEPTDSFSVVMWYYADSATQSGSKLFSHQRCNDPGFQLSVDSNSLDARVQSTISYNQDTTETWNNVVMTYNGTESTIRLYLNGQLVQSGQNTSGAWSSYDPGYSEVWLGKRYPCAQTDDFTGQIAFFRFYNSRQLSLEEIQTIYDYTRWRFGV